MSAPQYPYPAPPPPEEKSSLKTALATGAIVASLVCNAFLLYQVHDLSTDTAKNRETMQSEIDTLKETNTAMTASQRKHLDEMKEELDSKAKQLNQEANQAASQAKKEALSYADQQAQKLQAENQRTADSVNKVNTDLSNVRQTAETATARLNDVGNDVNGVKSDLASTKTDLAQTKTELRAVRGDLGSTNSLVATNGKEIEELRRRGERNITEFKLYKTKDFQKVGDIAVILRKTDAKKNKFTLEVRADDRITEKKDRNINEPLQFYVSKSLYELVVNTVGKDSTGKEMISGYLSTPKYGNTRGN
ncbi:MAG TPA: hypothetical protein VEF06_00040 [Bryobacteraceae bacterium]|nr:hypothetical protein [Bryobacteraceae bacterium]